jgi:hypothetical protein
VFTGTSICISLPSQQVTIHEHIAVELPTASIGHDKYDLQAIRYICYKFTNLIILLFYHPFLNKVVKIVFWVFVIL